MLAHVIALAVLGQSVGVGVGVSMRKPHERAARAIPPLSHFAPYKSPPSVSNLPSDPPVAGMTLVACYTGSGASATEWVPCGAGPTLAKVEGGADFATGATTALVGADVAVAFASGDYYQAASASDVNITTDDFVIETYFRGATSSQVASKRSGAGAGLRFDNGGTAWSVIMHDGTNTATTTCTTSTTDTWHYGLVYADRSVSSANGLIAYSNGAACTGGNPSAVGSLSSASLFSLGASAAGTSNTSAHLALYRIWTCSGCLDNSSLTEEAATASQRYALLDGLKLRRGGSPWPTVATRASPATLRKCEGGVTQLHTVGANWLRVEKLCDGTIGYLSEPAVTNLAVQSEDVTTSWTELDAGDTQSTSNSAPDGANTADGNIADATDGDHGFSQAVTVTAATYAWSVFAKAGNKTHAYLSDDTVTNATGYFNLSTCATATKGAGATALFAESYGNGWCRVGMSFTGTAAAHTFKMQSADADGDKTVTGDSATVNTYFWGAQVELWSTMTSYVRTTTGSVARSGDTLEYASTGNVDSSAGSLVCLFRMTDYNNTLSQYVATVSDNSSNVHQLRVSAGDVAQYLVANGGVSQADINGTTDVSSGALYVASASWATDAFRLCVDGVPEGTPDTAGTPPGTLTEIAVGANSTGGQLGGNIYECRIYDREVRK